MNSQTPCDEPWEGVNEYGEWVKEYTCPFSDDPTGDLCRNCCGVGVDE